MATASFNSRSWTDAAIPASPRGTVTVARPSSGVLYLRVLRGVAIVGEVKTWASTGPATVSLDYEPGDTARVWIGAATAQTVTVTTVNR